jgi:aminoglycoside phosphotransferase (APT) family kinase protein
MNQADLTALGAPLAQGRTAAVYAWPGDQIVKLFFDWVGPDAVVREAEISRVVHASGLPVPAVGELVQGGGRTGIVYARLHGQSMLTELMRRPWTLRRHAWRLAELHGTIHAVTLPDHAVSVIPHQVDALAHKIEHASPLAAAQRGQLLTALRAMPVDARLCHGDFHPDNVILTDGGPVIIDWIDATRGCPAADVARTSVILRAASATSQVGNPFMRAFARAFHATYLAHYRRLRPDVGAELERWLPLVAAARLSEGIPELEAWLVAQVQAGPA